MKIAAIIIGVLLIILGVIIGIVSFLLPSITDGKVNFNEAVYGLIAAVVLILLGFLIAVVAGILYLKGRKKAAPEISAAGK